MVVVDGFAVFLNVLFLGSGLAGIALAYDYLKRMGIERGEYYILLLFSISGMMLMAYAFDLIVVFLALELLSIPLYVLAGFARPSRRARKKLAQVLPARVLFLRFRALRGGPGLWGDRPYRAARHRGGGE